MKLFTALFLLIAAGLSGVCSLSAAPTAKPLWKAQDNSLPAESGPGIVICEPTASPTNADTINFGTGCALWLQVIVGGQPQLGKTPLWADLDRARTELKRPDLQLSSAEARNLGPILGITHAVVGTLRGTEPHLTLTYRLLEVPSGTSVGAAISLAGTEAQIAAGLPQMAKILTKRLGIPDSSLPASIDLTPGDLRMLGQVRWRKTPDTDVQRTTIEAIAAHNPVAGILNLVRKRGGHTPHYHTAVETLLTQAGDNTFVWAVIAQRTNQSLLPHTAQLAALTARYPHNYSLALVEAFRDRLIQDHKPELDAASRAIRNAPHSPESWQTYADTVSGMAGDIRQGRVYGALSSQEADSLNHLYAASEAASQHVVQLDPAYAAAWETLAVSATFNSDSVLADHALQTAFALSQDKMTVYYWALQMYQPKWDDEPLKLNHFAHLAAADTTLNVDGIMTIAPELEACGYPKLQAQMRSGFIARQQAALKLHPSNGQTHLELAVMLGDMGKDKEALKEYKQAAVLSPDDATIHYHYGVALDRAQDYKEAEVQLRAALKIDPDFPAAHYYLSDALALQNSGKNDEAKRELQTTLVLDPTYTLAYRDLATYSQVENNPAEAISEYQSAIRYGDTSRTIYANLIDVLSTSGQYEQLITTGAAALNIYGDDIMELYPAGTKNLYDMMADAYIHQKKWNDALTMCQSAIANNADDPFAHETLAEAYLGAGRITDAQAEWKKVLTLSSEPQKALAEGFLKKYP